MVEQSTTFSMRWGIPILDEGFTQFPNYFWRLYHRVVSRQEWLFICHLATYKYDSKNGQCRPSLETVAREMGYQDVRSVQKLRESLQAKTYKGTPFLQVYEIQGKPNLYDFSGLSLCLFGLETGKDTQPQTGESQFTSKSKPLPTGESQFTLPVNPSSPSPVNPSSPKEEDLKEKKEEEEEVPLSDIWSQFLEETEMTLPRSAFDTWIRPMVPTSITSDGHVEVNVPTEAVQEWLEYRLAIPIERTLLGLLRSAGHDVEAIEIVYTIAAPEVSRPDMPDLSDLPDHNQHTRADPRPGKRVTVTLPAPGIPACAGTSKPVQPPRSKTALPSVL